MKAMKKFPTPSTQVLLNNDLRCVTTELMQMNTPVHRGESRYIPNPDQEFQPDDTIKFLEPDDQIKGTQDEAAC